MGPNDTYFLCRTRQATATEAAPAAAKPTGMDLDIPVDPNEPTYCLCNQVSYGDMVACDNPNVCNFPFFPSLLRYLFYFVIWWKSLPPTVQDRMVPFWLRWSERSAKRKMVLSRLFRIEKSTQKVDDTENSSWNPNAEVLNSSYQSYHIYLFILHIFHCFTEI